MMVRSPKLTLSPACPFKPCHESHQTQSHAKRCEGERGTKVRDMDRHVREMDRHVRHVRDMDRHVRDMDRVQSMQLPRD